MLLFFSTSTYKTEIKKCPKGYRVCVRACESEWDILIDRCNHRCFLGGAGEWAWEKFSASETHILEKKMAIHSSILAWKIPWPEEPGGLCSSWCCKRVTTH